MKKMMTKPKKLMSYQERLRGYEADKDELLRKAAGLPDAEFQAARPADRQVENLITRSNQRKGGD